WHADHAKDKIPPPGAQTQAGVSDEWFSKPPSGYRLPTLTGDSFSLRVRPVAHVIRRPSNHRAGSGTPLPDTLKNSLRQAKLFRPGQGLAMFLPLRLAIKPLLRVTHSGTCFQI